MSSPPPVTQIAQDAYDWLSPIQADDAARGYPLLAFLGGIGEMFREVEQLVRARPGRDPWQQAFNIDACPDFQVAWLGQMVGQRVSASDTPDAQRAQIKAQGGFKRGRPSTLVANVQATLTGMQRVQLIERSADAWTMTIVTDPTETPNTAATNAAAQSAKAAALVLTMLQSSTPFWFQGSRTFAAAPNTFASATLSQVT